MQLSHTDLACRKTYTFFLDTNPVLCPISHIITLGFNNNAFDPNGVNSPAEIFKLHVKPGLLCQAIPWAGKKLKSPVFLAPNNIQPKAKASPNKPLTYAMYHRWLKRLGTETGFMQTLTTYCLRRATGNAVNSKYSLIPWMDL